jgi:outer membrane immunogenic protein
MIVAKFGVDWSVAMRGLMVAALLLGAVSGAQAADMPDLPILRGSFTDGLTTASVNWQGGYFGGQVAWGSVTSNVPAGINSDMQSPFSGLAPAGVNYNWQPLGQAHSINTGFGAFAGYNLQWDDVIVGVEANYIHDGFSSRTNSTGLQYANDNVTVLSVTNSSAVVKLSDFGSFRLRTGYAVGCFLPYVFLGAGFGDQTIDRAVSASPPPVRSVWMTDSKSKLVYGYSLGGGFDVMLVGGLFARAEYEYRRITSNIESNLNTVRVGLGYKF